MTFLTAASVLAFIVNGVILNTHATPSEHGGVVKLPSYVKTLFLLSEVEIAEQSRAPVVVISPSAFKDAIFENVPSRKVSPFPAAIMNPATESEPSISKLLVTDVYN